MMKDQNKLIPLSKYFSKR